MKKSASGLAKLAVSRWREAIYSGELPLDQREMLKAHMGATPERYVRGIGKQEAGLVGKGVTTVNRLGAGLVEAYKQYRSGNKPFSDLIDAIPEALPSMSGSRTTLMDKQIFHAPTADKVNFVGAALTSKEIPVREKLRLLKGFKDNPHLSQELGALTLGHEIGEATSPALRSSRAGAFQVAGKNPLPGRAKPSVALAGLGLGALVDDALTDKNVMDPLTQTLRDKFHPSAKGNHVSPSVLVNELRSARMMSPELQRLQAAVRTRTGEYGNVPDIMSLRAPSVKSPEGRKMMERMQSAADASYEPLDNYLGKWMDRGKTHLRPAVGKAVRSAERLRTLFRR